MSDTNYSLSAHWFNCNFLIKRHIAVDFQCTVIFKKCVWNWFFKKWAIPGLFFVYFCLFITVDSKQMFNKFCRWLDSNCGHLVSEATALPTEPHNHCPVLEIVNMDSNDQSKLINCLGLQKFEESSKIEILNIYPNCWMYHSSGNPSFVFLLSP